NQLFFWMTILNNSNDVESLYNRTFDWIKENNENHTLEYMTMMIKEKRNQDLLEYLINQDYIESSLLLAILLECIDQIRDRIPASLETEDT
ncbi:unnamed protein product, partial [Adineta steineri]